MGRFAQSPHVDQTAEKRRLLHCQAGVLVRDVPTVRDVHRHAGAVSVQANDRQPRRIDARMHRDPMAAGDAAGHQTGLRQRARPVVHARVRHVHARQLADHRLQLEHRLERALTDLRLVRRVRGVVLAARNDVSDRARNEVPVSAPAQERSDAIARDDVLPR